MIDKAPSCDDPTDPGLLPVDVALQRIQRVLPQAAFSNSENVSLLEARNRILATDVHSSIDVPPYTNSAMDGFAIHRDDIPADTTGEHVLEVTGTAWAG